MSFYCVEFKTRRLTAREEVATLPVALNLAAKYMSTYAVTSSRAGDSVTVAETLSGVTTLAFACNGVRWAVDAASVR